jgi:hypothetical protein
MWEFMVLLCARPFLAPLVLVVVDAGGLKVHALAVVSQPQCVKTIRRGAFRLIGVGSLDPGAHNGLLKSHVAHGDVLVTRNTDKTPVPFDGNEHDLHVRGH